MAPIHNQASPSSYPPHILAQKLNNRGAQFIETKQYDRAITVLVKALRISERLAAQSMSSCCCRFCTLDECMSTGCYARKTTTSQQQQQAIDCCDCSMPLETPGSASNSPSNSSYESSSEVSPCGYIYTQPIYVPAIPLQEGHEMGITLSLLVIFNLALAHQLSAMHQRSPNSLKLLEKSSQLYELAYQLQIEQGSAAHCSNQVHSLRFTMVIANNLGGIHRLVNDHAKHAMCMQHLLSTMMYLIDCHYPEDYIELDGFFRNTSHLILQRVCASAA